MRVTDGGAIRVPAVFGATFFNVVRTAILTPALITFFAPTAVTTAAEPIPPVAIVIPAVATRSATRGATVVVKSVPNPKSWPNKDATVARA